MVPWLNLYRKKNVNNFFLFKDSVIKDALPVMHLIDSMKSGVIDYSIIKSGSQLDAKVFCKTKIMTKICPQITVLNLEFETFFPPVNDIF